MMVSVIDMLQSTSGLLLVVKFSHSAGTASKFDWLVRFALHWIGRSAISPQIASLHASAVASCCICRVRAKCQGPEAPDICIWQP